MRVEQRCPKIGKRFFFFQRRTKLANGYNGDGTNDVRVNYRRGDDGSPSFRRPMWDRPCPGVSHSHRGQGTLSLSLSVTVSLSLAHEFGAAAVLTEGRKYDQLSAANNRTRRRRRSRRRSTLLFPRVSSDLIFTRSAIKYYGEYFKKRTRQKGLRTLVL